MSIPFTPTHVWLVDGKRIPVHLGAEGQMYRESEWWACLEAAEGNTPNLYEELADGRLIVVRTVGFREQGTLEALP